METARAFLVDCSHRYHSVLMNQILVFFFPAKISDKATSFQCVLYRGDYFLRMMQAFACSDRTLPSHHGIFRVLNFRPAGPAQKAHFRLRVARL